MSPVPGTNNDGQSSINHSLFLNVFLQLVTFAQLSHLLIARKRLRTPVLSLSLGSLAFVALLIYVSRLRPLQGDVHFLTFTSRKPHPVTSEEKAHGYWHDAALICIFASASMQLQRLSSTSPIAGMSTVAKSVDGPARGGRLLLTGNTRRRWQTWLPEWAVVVIGVLGSVALAGMRSPLLEAFLGGDFDTNQQLSGMSTLIAFLLVLWRGVTFLDILSTLYALGEAEDRESLVIALWQRASLPMAAELIFDFLSILFYESITFKTFSRDEVGHATAGIQVFDSPVSIALSALTIAFARILVERHARLSSSSGSITAPSSPHPFSIPLVKT
ncbi:hypothetical protein PIIN_08176 [Serendipita indica DSM 11827]|uniref:Uncharacterized protein n=1 Tax=Serendipita indica (strain DSM 11827) TaxID=1109443 RepID=G4TSD0_SERID|nr:hypothetical protein PIIN_08176 [Serendipita indica DSM 11827]